MRGFGAEVSRRFGLSLDKVHGIKWPRESAPAMTCGRRVYENLNLLQVDPREELPVGDDSQIITVADGVDLPTITAFRLLAAKLSSRED